MNEKTILFELKILDEWMTTIGCGRVSGFLCHSIRYAWYLNRINQTLTKKKSDLGAGGHDFFLPSLGLIGTCALLHPL